MNFLSMIIPLLSKLSGPKSILLSIFLIIISVLVYFNKDKLLGYVGIESKEVIQQRLTEAESTIDNLLLANEALKNEILTQINSCKANESILADVCAKDSNTAINALILKHKKELELRDLEDKYEVEKMTITQKELSDKTSTVNIRHLNDVYSRLILEEIQ